MKQFLEGGWEKTSILVFPSTKPRCNRCIKQDIIYYVGIFARRFRFLLSNAMQYYDSLSQVLGWFSPDYLLLQAQYHLFPLPSAGLSGT